MRNRIDCFCDLRKDELPVKTSTITEIMAQSYVGRLEQQNTDLKQQLASAKEEISSHLKALDVSKDWHDKQKQELLDKIQRLESEVEFLRKQQTLLHQVLIVSMLFQKSFHCWNLLLFSFHLHFYLDLHIWK